MAGVLGANRYLGEMTEMKQTLEAIIASRPSFQVGKVETYQTPTDYRLVLEDRERYHKGTLAEALFRKEEQMNWPFTFGLSISDMQMDEPMHLAMRARGHHAIVVKNPYEIGHVPWLTYASHRFHDYRESIDLLEELAEPRNLENGFWHHVLQSIRGIGQEIRVFNYASSPWIYYRQYACSHEHHPCFLTPGKYINSCF